MHQHKDAHKAYYSNTEMLHSGNTSYANERVDARKSVDISKYNYSLLWPFVLQCQCEQAPRLSGRMGNEQQEVESYSSAINPKATKYSVTCQSDVVAEFVFFFNNYM